MKRLVQDKKNLLLKVLGFQIKHNDQVQDNIKRDVHKRLRSFSQMPGFFAYAWLGFNLTI
jgi:hypothetical protein